MSPREELREAQRRFLEKGPFFRPEVLRLMETIDAVLAEPSPPPPSHPDRLEHEGKCWTFVGAAIAGPDIRVGDLVVSIDQKTKSVMPEEFVKEFVSGRVWEGAALYRLIEPRVWEFEGTFGSDLLNEVCERVDLAQRYKVTLTEILEPVITEKLGGGE